MSFVVRLDELSYERTRVQCAKTLKVRVTFLDALRERMREEIHKFHIRYPRKCDARLGEFRCYQLDAHADPDLFIGAWIIASADDAHGEINLLLLANGNAKVVTARPID